MDRKLIWRASTIDDCGDFRVHQMRVSLNLQIRFRFRLCELLIFDIGLKRLRRGKRRLLHNFLIGLLLPNLRFGILLGFGNFLLGLLCGLVGRGLPSLLVLLTCLRSLSCITFLFE